MSNRLASSLILSLALITSACGAPMKTPDIKQNPHPKMRYEITVTTHDAPGPFDSVEVSAGYDVDNTQCVPLSPGSGATIAPEKVVPLTLTQVNGDTYTVVVYVDQLQDEDYYGLGVCHWKLTSVDAGLRVKKSIVIAGLTLHELLSQQPVTRYFSNLNFTDDQLRGPDTGNPAREDFEDDAARTFSVTVSSKEATK